MSALTIDALTVTRGDRVALDGVGTNFAAGKLSVVIGPNGAGKSTLLAAAAGLLAPQAGTVTLGDTPLARIPRRDLARRRAYLPQDARVEWPISVERVVALGLTPQLPAFGRLPMSMQPAIERALAECDLLDLRDRPATSLSGGELARAMLARAIVGEPELLIVDEPTSGLDPRHAIDAMRRLRALADAGRTVIVALHDLSLAAGFADHVIGLQLGRVVIDADAATGFAAEPLTSLFDLPVRVDRDAQGVAIRFAQ